MAGPAAALGPILKSLAKQQAMSAAARSRQKQNGGGGGGGGALKTIFLIPFLVLLAIVLALGSCGETVSCDPGATTGGGPVPGTWDGPGSLGGVLGTGVSPAELRHAQATPASGPRITAGPYRSTAYAPAAGGVNCDTAGACTGTSSGIRVDKGLEKKYLIASNPALNQYGNLVYIWPNPYSWKGPFVVADTGNDFHGHGRLDFYTFEPGSEALALAWGNAKMVKLSRKPIVDGGPTPKEAAPVGTGSSGTPAPSGSSGSAQKMLRPVATGPFTSPFGNRSGEMHEGVDIGVPIGTPVVAVLDGTVVQAGVVSGYGHYLCIAHAGNLTTCDGHLSKILVTKGAKVKRGQKVALSGNEGHSTGPHLHFEVRKGQTANSPAVNPAPYLSGAQTVKPTPTPAADPADAGSSDPQCSPCQAAPQTANANSPPGGPTGALPGSVPAPYRDLFVKAARAANVDPALLAAIFYYGEHGKSWPNAKGPWASSSAGAQGPFQFEPSTWSRYARDGNNDGKKDINNLDDAAYGAAAYIAANGGKVGAGDFKIRKAIFAYNHATWYVNLVFNGFRDLQGSAGDEGATADSANPDCGGEPGSVDVGTAAANGWDISGAHAMVSYNQGDPQWASKPYGSSTIGPAGCGPTSMSMVLATLTKRKFTPESVAKRWGRFYVPGGGSSWGLFTTAPREVGLKVSDLGTNIEQLRDTIRKGGLGIISVDPGYFTGAGHIMVIRGMNSDGTAWYLDDPNGKGKHGDSETRSFSTQFLRSQGAMKNVWAISK